jgi:hypothetical protein
MKNCHQNTCHMKSYVNGTPVTEHLSHEVLCHWNICHMKSYIVHTHTSQCYVMGTLVTWSVLSLEHLSHKYLCHWTLVPLRDIIRKLFTWTDVTGTLVTFLSLAKEKYVFQKMLNTLQHWAELCIIWHHHSSPESRWLQLPQHYFEWF